MSYIDDQLGTLLDALEVAGLSESTPVVFLSDHGEALGERGLWFKRSFFDCALQIPFIVSSRDHISPARCSANVSLVDLFPTVIDPADPGIGLAEIETTYDGQSLRAQVQGDGKEASGLVYAEMSGEGLVAPAAMVMEGQRRRRLVDRAHAKGPPPSWDYDTSGPGDAQYFRPCNEFPSASNYNGAFEVRSRPDAETPNHREFP